MSANPIVDLSHPIDGRIPMFPGLPVPEIEELLSREQSRTHYAGGTTFAMHRYTLAGNSGTYMDSPFHRFEDGEDLAALPLERVVDLPGVLIDVRAQIAGGSRAIGSGAIPGVDLRGCAVLVLTGWDTRWESSDYLAPSPFLTADVAESLAARDVALVGIDTWNIDDTADGRRPVHSSLLRAGIPIVENLRGLGRLTGREFRFSAAPLSIRGGSAVSVRAYAVLAG